MWPPAAATTGWPPAGWPSGVSLESQVAAILSALDPGIWADLSSISTLSQDSAGTSPVVATTNPIGKIADNLGRNSFTQSSAISRPLYTVSGGVASAKFDGFDDGLVTGTLTPGINMDCYIALKRNSSALAVLCHIIGANNPYFAVFDSSSTSKADNTSSPTISYAVDGVAVNGGGYDTTRVQLHNACPVGSWHVLAVKNIVMTALVGWTNFAICGYSGARASADIAGLILCPVQSPTNSALIQKYLGSKVGLSL